MYKLLTDWGAVIAGILALAAAWWTVRATRSTAKDEIAATRDHTTVTAEQTAMNVQLEQERIAREVEAIRASLAVEIRAFLRVLIDIDRVVRTSLSGELIVSSPTLLLATELPKPTIYPAVADRLALLGASFAASVTAFFTDLDRVAIALAVVAKRQHGTTLVEDTDIVKERFEHARQSSLALLSKLPPDDGDADLKEKIKAIGQKPARE
jgi:hypothetical protein